MPLTSLSWLWMASRGAASNHDTATSFVGGNVAFRPYFLDVAAKIKGWFYAIGTILQKRG